MPLRFADGKDALVDFLGTAIGAWDDVAWISSVPAACGFTRAIAHRLRWATNCGATPDLFKPAWRLRKTLL